MKKTNEAAKLVKEAFTLNNKSVDSLRGMCLTIKRALTTHKD